MISFFRATLTLVLSVALFASHLYGTTRTHKAAASTGSKTQGSHKAKRRGHKLHGQEAIEPARVVEIQKALIRDHYLNGEADGKWDATTEGAMQRYQADHGWQTKLMPDPRAIKKLGLGPDYSNAINAKNSSFGEPPPASTIPAAQAEGFAAAAGVKP
jgi:peptidoglycan hydrolase-like protein with peptidoglycan-binding domain